MPQRRTLIHAAVSDSLSPPPRPSGLRLLGRIAGHAWQQARAQGLSDGVRVLVGGGRMLGGRGALTQLFAIPAFARLMTAQPQADAAFFASHRHFLSSGFDMPTRVACALDHFRFEQARLAPGLLPALHGEGLCLWQHDVVDGAGYEVRLRANAPTRHEGPLSLVLRHGGETLHELSFAWVDATRLGPEAGEGALLFATRNQSVHAAAPALARFRGDFPQNSPAYFVLAALHGLALAFGQHRIAGVRDRCQIAFEPAHARSFRRSYDEFWTGFGGRPLGAHGLEMPVPAVVKPIERVPSKHRARARQRREHWRQVAEAAQAALSPYVRR